MSIILKNILENIKYYPFRVLTKVSLCVNILTNVLVCNTKVSVDNSVFCCAAHCRSGDVDNGYGGVGV